MFSAVSRFEATIREGAVVGYAAPAGGHRPAAVELVSDERVIATAAATRFSEAANAAGLRHGWCGFEVEGVGEAFGVGETVALRCAVSGDVLARPALTDLIEIGAGGGNGMSVEALIARVRRHDCATSGEQILPFAQAFRSRVGIGEFVEKTMAMLLRRFVPFNEATTLANLRGDEDAATILRRATTMRAFTADPLAYVPGPFHPEFQYGLHAFG